MSRGEQTDETLLVRWREGDTQAGDELVQRHFGAIYRFFSGKLPDQAKDLTQRTLLGCVEGKDRGTEIRNVRAFMFGVARNVLLQQFDRHYGKDRAVEEHRASLHDAGLGPGRGPITVREDQRLLLTALSRLPVDIQLTLELHYWSGLKLGEIAEVTEVPTGTVKSRLHRGRTLLREIIGELEADPTARAATMASAERFMTREADET